MVKDGAVPGLYLSRKSLSCGRHPKDIRKDGWGVGVDSEEKGVGRIRKGENSHSKQSHNKSFSK